MKYDITPEDLNLMEHDLKNDRTLKHLRNMSFYKFSIGDVLIREIKSYGHEDEAAWRVELGSGDIPHKYVYVFENELSVGYIRRLSVNGRKFVDRAVCITEFDPDNVRFKLDPEYADHMLLSAGEDTEFDATTRYDELKKRRESIHRRNKKLAIPIPDEAAAVAWMKTLKVGDQVWWGHSINNIYKDAYYVKEINFAVPGQPPKPGTWPHYNTTVQDHIKLTSSIHANSYGSNIYASSMSRYYFFAQRPHFLDEIVN